MAEDWTDNPFAIAFGVGQQGRRRRMEDEASIERASISAGPGHASVAENRRQFEAQQAIMREAQGAWVSFRNQEAGGPEGEITNDVLQRAMRRYIASPEFIAIGQAGRSHMEVIQGLLAAPTSGAPFTLGPGQRRYGADGRLITEGPPPTTPPRQFESSVDTTRTTMLRSLVEGGQQASAQLQELTQLADPLLRTGQLYPSGTWTGMAASMGLPVSGRTDIQVIQSILDGLTPLQRRGLPGAASDRDMATFRGRLPDLLRTAEGNREILAFLLAQARAGASAGTIASEAFTRRDADPAEVFARASGVRFADVLAATRNEIEERRTALVEGATGIDVRAIDRMTDQELRAFTLQMQQRPGGIPPSIRRRILSRAQEIERSLDN